jgi:hypothetical protein
MSWPSRRPQSARQRLTGDRRHPARPRAGGGGGGGRRCRGCRGRGPGGAVCTQTEMSSQSWSGCGKARPASLPKTILVDSNQCFCSCFCGANQVEKAGVLLSCWLREAERAGPGSLVARLAGGSVQCVSDGGCGQNGMLDDLFFSSIVGFPIASDVDWHET